MLWTCINTLSPGWAKPPHFVSCVESRGSLSWYNLQPGLSSKVENQAAASSPAYWLLDEILSTLWDHTIDNINKLFEISANKYLFINLNIWHNKLFQWSAIIFY